MLNCLASSSWERTLLLLEYSCYGLQRSLFLSHFWILFGVQSSDRLERCDGGGSEFLFDFSVILGCSESILALRVVICNSKVNS